jgi:hypothetical protein
MKGSIARMQTVTAQRYDECRIIVKAPEISSKQYNIEIP